MVSKERGAALAHNQNIPFLETSAKTNLNVEEVFETLAKQILKKVSCVNHYTFHIPHMLDQRPLLYKGCTQIVASLQPIFSV